MDLDDQISLLLEDQDFWAIQRRVSTFNIFEAIGGVRAELRHSSFLAYLLSPSRPHGLSARPLQQLLRGFLERMAPEDRPITTLELLVSDLDVAVVHREKDSIDILIEIEPLSLVVLIENKIGARAGEGQLKRYRELVASRYPKWRHMFVFLTPDGHSPDDEHYVAFDYAEVGRLLDNVAEDDVAKAPEETRLIVRHYVEMLRRNVVDDERLRSLAEKLYDRHAEALNFIFAHKPKTASLLDIVTGAVKENDALVVDSSGVSTLRFAPAEWDEKLSFKGDTAQWTRTGRGLLFEVKTYTGAPGRLNVSLIIGPGNPAHRAQLYAAAQKRKDVFVGLVKPMGVKWVTIFSRDLQTAEAATNLPLETQASNVLAAWHEFEASSLPGLSEAVVELDASLGLGGAEHEAAASSSA